MVTAPSSTQAPEIDEVLHAVVINTAHSASQTLSKWLQKGVQISTAGFLRIPLHNVHQELPADEPAVIVHVPWLDPVPAHFLLVMPLSAARELVERLMPAADAPPRAGGGEPFDDMAQSCLMETTNIIASAFGNQVSKWLDAPVTISPPELRIDLPAAALNELLAEQASAGDYLLLARTAFRMEGSVLDCDLFLLPLPPAYRLMAGSCP